MEVKNVMEQLVWDTLNKVLEKTPDACGCEKCRADMVAFALNKLRPRYAASERGETITKAMALEFQSHLDVLTALTQAVEVISKNPHHS